MSKKNFNTGNVDVDSMHKFINNLITDGNKQYASDFSDGISDGYHTFGQLYHHRTLLFSALCKANRDIAGKSRWHATGDMYKGMFIAWIATPDGIISYHCDNKYWDAFEVKEFLTAPPYQNTTPDQEIEFLTSL